MYMTKVFDLNYMKLEASNWKLRVCSCGWWSKHFISACNFCVSKDGLVEFPGQSQRYFLTKTEKDIDHK
jgi:hypothetical protein